MDKGRCQIAQDKSQGGINFCVIFFQERLMERCRTIRRISGIYRNMACCVCVILILTVLQLVLVYKWPSTSVLNEHQFALTETSSDTCIRLATLDNEQDSPSLQTYSDPNGLNSCSVNKPTAFNSKLERNDVTYQEHLGMGIYLNTSDLSARDQQLISIGYQRHGFNEFVSDRIPLKRPTPDFTNSVCQGIVYPHDLPPTSIIICFHNEAWSTLLRTVFSILDHTPGHLIEEIILVDDFSDHEELGTPLDKALADLSLVKLVRSTSRIGLVRARLLGVAMAVGSVLTFLDSHIECIQGWLPPLLSRIQVDDTIVPYPILHIINHDTFGIEKVAVGKRGLFNWMDLSYFPYIIPDYVMKHRESAAEPIRSPTMPGGIFSISSRYFQFLGAV